MSKYIEKDTVNDFNFNIIERELGIVVPTIYIDFIEIINKNRIKLAQYRIYYDTETLLRGNLMLRETMGEPEALWQSHYLDFGVGDGCGNYFFIPTSGKEANQINLMSHDPLGIEERSSGTEFFAELMAELESNFNGPNKYRYDGNCFWI